jgi:hypothetical protein
MHAERTTRRRASGARIDVREDSCGCAMGARFTAAALIVLGAWYGWQWHSATMSAGGAVTRVLVGSFVVGGIGKLFGILRFRARARGNRVRSGSADQHVERRRRDPVGHHEKL